MEVAERKYPEEYREMSQLLSDYSKTASNSSGKAQIDTISKKKVA
jgi:hypothetical protein